MMSSISRRLKQQIKGSDITCPAHKTAPHVHAARPRCALPPPQASQATARLLDQHRPSASLPSKRALGGSAVGNLCCPRRGFISSHQEEEDEEETGSQATALAGRGLNPLGGAAPWRHAARCLRRRGEGRGGGGGGAGGGATSRPFRALLVAALGASTAPSGGRLAWRWKFPWRVTQEAHVAGDVGDGLANVSPSMYRAVQLR
ncbi:unnamed protein product [Lampetra planeri]